MAKKKENLSPEERLANALVPESEQPYKVPDNWVWVRFEYLVKEMTDGPFGSNLKTEHYTDKKEVRIIQLSNIGESGWREENTRYTTFEHSKTISRSIVNSGDIVIAKMMPAGRAIIVPNNEKMYVLSSDAIKVVPYNFTCPEFFVNGINNTFFSNQVQENTQGITRARTSLRKLKEYAFPLPPLPEQHRIVACIESLFEKLDHAKELVQSALDSFETRKAAILHQAFTGQLTAKWREENDVRLDSWEEKWLGEVIKVSSGRPLTVKDMNVEGKIPVYGGNGITGYHNEYFVDETTIVIGRVGYYCGSVHLIEKKAWITDNALIVSCHKNQVNTKFLFFLLSYSDLRQNKSSTAQPVISGSKIYKIPVKIPILTEQQEIVRILDNFFEKEQQAKELTDIIEKIDLMKKSILVRAFRGELGTHNSEEESAEKMLKDVLLHK